MNNELVFYHNIKDEPYTTNEIIAEFRGVDLDSINRLTRKYKNKLEKYGSLGFEIRPGSEHRKIWHYNKRQATLLITFMKNTQQVINFKTALVDSFFEARKELSQAQIQLELNHKTNKTLGEAVKEHFPNNTFMYSNFHRLAYRIAIGIEPAQVCKERHVKNAQDVLTSDELETLERYRTVITNLIELGMDYQQIKQTLTLIAV